MDDTIPTTAPRGLLAATLVAQMAFGLLAMTICLPSMQEWGAIFGAGAARVQLTFSGYVLTYGALQLVYGPLSDRHGRKPLLLIGMALAGAASLAAAFAPSMAWLVAARLVQGAGAAACMVVGRAAVQDLFQGPERTRVMAYVGMAMGLCPPTATVLGGQLHVRLGWQSNFVLLAVLAVLLFTLAWRVLPNRPATIAPGTHWLHEMAAAYARLARERAFVLNVVIISATGGAFYAFLGGAPLVLKNYGVGPGEVGFYIMIAPLSYIVGNYIATRIVLRTGERWMATAGQASTIAGIAIVVVLALAGLHTPMAFAAPLVLMGIGHGLLVPPTLAATVGLVPALAGAAAAIAGVTQQLTGAFGGHAVGWLSHHDAAPLGVLMLAFTLCAAAAQAVLFARVSPAGPRPRRA